MNKASGWTGHDRFTGTGGRFVADGKVLRKKKAPLALGRNGAFRRGKKPGTTNLGLTTDLRDNASSAVLYAQPRFRFHRL